MLPPENVRAIRARSRQHSGRLVGDPLDRKVPGPADEPVATDPLRNRKGTVRVYKQPANQDIVDALHESLQRIGRAAHESRQVGDEHEHRNTAEPLQHK